MVNLKITAFHMDFSTLEMERGMMTVIPSGVTYTTKPTIVPPLFKLEGILIDEIKDIKNDIYTDADLEKALGNVSQRNKNSEAWLFKNPEALASVRRGLNDAAQGRVSRVDLDTL